MLVWPFNISQYDLVGRANEPRFLKLRSMLLTLTGSGNRFSLVVGCFIIQLKLGHAAQYVTLQVVISAQGAGCHGHVVQALLEMLTG